MARDDEPDPEDVTAFERIIEREAARHSEIECRPYDGVNGLPPEWMPPPVLDRFRRTRDYLLEISDPDFLAVQVKAAQTDGDPIVPGTATDPHAYLQSIYELAHVLYAAEADQLAGLEILAGPDAALGRRHREGARKGGRAEKTQRRGEDLRPRNQAIQEDARRLLSQGRRLYELAGILSQKYELSARHIRTILAEGGIKKKRN